MQGDKQVLVELNNILLNELTAINQYFLQARMYKYWGLSQLDKKEYHASISAMKNADELIERILFLQGFPNLQQLGKLLIGETAQENLESDIKLTNQHIDALRNAIAIAETVLDFVSRDMLKKILIEKEEWIDWLDTQIDLIAEITLPNYLQTKI